MALSTTMKFVIAGICIALGLFFLLLGSVLDKTYWSFFLCVPILLISVPLIMVPPNPNGDGSFFESLANFFVGFFLFSVLGLLFVLRHIEAITGRDLIFDCFAILFLAAAVVFVGLAVRRSDTYMQQY